MFGMHRNLALVGETLSQHRVINIRVLRCVNNRSNLFPSGFPMIQILRVTEELAEETVIDLRLQAVVQ